mmetsp:Transcript_6757/g.18885  ORF Transcript_6757/g.18885 Transcript_6757/m.18885 type:complete len:695 (+) Transcript_6757:110-2194(+)
MAPAASELSRSFILVKHPRRNACLGFAAAVTFLAFVSRSSKKQSHNASCNGTEKAHADGGVRHLVTRILSRACNGRELSTLFRLSLMLLLRTYGSVWVSRHWGRMVNSVVILDFSRLRRLVTEFAGMTVLLSLLNSLLKYCRASLRLQLRESITRWCHRTLMQPDGIVYYNVNRLGDSRVENCDHQIASDVARFSDVLTELVSQSLKPAADFLVYSVELSRVQGLATPLTLYAWFVVVSLLSSTAVPPFGELAATEQRLEGQFRCRHSALITHCEQIAFLRGNGPEQRCLDSALDKLLGHCWHTVDMSLKWEIFRQYLNKYFVTVIGLILVARPLQVLRKRTGPLPYTSDRIAEYFSSTWRNMESMASAIQDLLELSDRASELGGFADRLENLMTALESNSLVLGREVENAKAGPHPPTFKRGDLLKFEHVTVMKPDGTILLRDLCLQVERGQRVLVTGPNGCGKSSLFRIISGMWPLVEGTITMPPCSEIHFMPQQTFVPEGTLRDLVIYPRAHVDVLNDNTTDRDIHQCLRWAHVSPLVITDGRAQLEFHDHGKTVRPELDDIRDWQKELSPGQKQRIGFARLFFHRPSFVILDECTNGVSPDVELDLYDRCAKMNMGVCSISHKSELKLFHDLELHYKGDIEGSWTLTPCAEIREKDKVVFSSALVKLPEADSTGRTESRITYERHIWYVG